MQQIGFKSNSEANCKKTGFTLIELLVVIAIIGLLSSIVLVSTSGAIRRARDIKRIAELRSISTALIAYITDHNDYPVGDDDTGPAGQGIDFSNDISTGNPDAFIPELTAAGYFNPTPGDPGGSLLGSYWYLRHNSNWNNIAIRQIACGTSPEAKAVILFWLEGGQSNNYRAGISGGNAICFY